MNRIQETDKARAQAILKAISREDLEVHYESDFVGADEDLLPDTRLILGGEVTIEGSTFEVSSILGPKKVPFRTIHNYPHAPDDVDEVEIGDAQHFDEIILMAVFYIMQEEWRRRCEYAAEITAEMAYHKA
jgi:hypothetical protein